VLRPPFRLRIACSCKLPFDRRAVEQATKTRQRLRALSPEGLCVRVRRFAHCRREIARGELALSGHEPTDRILEGLAGY